MVVRFHHPKSPHCKNLEPVYKRVAQKLEETDLEIVTALVDGSQNKQLTEDYRVGAYPAIYLFRYGMYQVYEGERDSDSILKWIQKKAGHDSTPLKSCQELKEQLTDTLTVTYFGKFEGKLFEKFMIAARSHDAFKFFHVDSDCSTDEYDAPSVPGLMLTRSFETSPMHFVGEENEHSIMFWMEVLRLPRVVPFGEEYIKTVFNSGRTSLILFYDKPDDPYV